MAQYAVDLGTQQFLVIHQPRTRLLKRAVIEHDASAHHMVDVVFA